MSKSTIGLRRKGLAAVATASLVMGGLAVGAGAANADADFTFERVAGQNRYATSAQIADRFGATTDAIIASGESGRYPDALSANYLAGIKKAPVLLTERDSLPASVLAELKENGVKNVTIVGGPLAVSEAVEARLKAENFNVVREAGRTRFDTNKEIIEAGPASAPSNVGLVTTGLNFPDALAVGPLAYKGGHPIGLANGTDMPDDTIAAMKAAGVTQALVVGGPIAVPESVITELESKGIDVIRRLARTTAGQTNRSGTAAEVAEYAVANLGFSTAGVNVASGRAFGDGADALSGGPLTGKQNRPMLITENENVAGSATLEYLRNHARTLTDGIIFGGPLAISDALKAQMEQAARSVTTNQSYTVTPAGNQTAQQGTVSQFTFSGITSSTVNIALVGCENIATDANGVTTFQNSSNPGGTGNVANLGGADAANDITVINGVPVAEANQGQRANDVTVTNGSVSFTVENAAQDCYVAVVWDDADNDNNLDLGANNQPTEAFANSGDVNVIAAEAGDNTGINATVASVDKAADRFSSTTATYFYDANDEFLLLDDKGTPSTADDTTSALTLAQFEARLSVDDVVTGTYRSEPANQSRFILDDVAPEAPATVAAVGTDDAVLPANKGKGGVEVRFSDSDTDTVASYQVFRATKPVPSVTGELTQCPAPGTAAYSQVGTVQDTNPTGDTYYFLDSTAQPPATTGGTTPTYCYYVVAVDEAGDVGEASNRAEAVADAASPAAANQAPSFTNETTAVNGGGTDGADVIVLDYSEAVDAGTIDVSNIPTSQEYEVRVTSGNVTTNVTANITDVDVANDKVTLTLSAASFGLNDTVRVDVRNGADGNTVGEATTPAGQTKLFQSVDDAVVATATNPPSPA